MADRTEIAWCDSTFNLWLLPKTFAALQLPLVANAVRLEVPKLMALANRLGYRLETKP